MKQCFVLVMVISTLSMEQSYLRDERHRRRRDDHETKQEPKNDNQVSFIQ